MNRPRLGVIALHGGNEFHRGDEPFLAELLRLAAERLVADGQTGPIRVSLVPTAAARGRPLRAAAEGVAAFERVARASGRAVQAQAVVVTDREHAHDPALAAVLRQADVIHFPGGDADLTPTLLRDAPVWAAILDALEAGAVLAGASAGAMAFAEVTWTPAGLIPGLGLVPDVVVAPHADAQAWERVVGRFGADLPAGIGILGLAEQTGVIVASDGSWRVVGPGEVRWAAAGRPEVLIVRDGATIRPYGAPGPELTRLTDA